MKSSKILHIFNLKKFRGVHRLLSSLLSYPVFRNRFEHIALIKDVSTMYYDVLNCFDEYYCYKFYNGFKLPSVPAFIRQHYIHKILNQTEPDVIFVWELKDINSLIKAFQKRNTDYGLITRNKNIIKIKKKDPRLADEFTVICPSKAIMHSLSLNVGVINNLKLCYNAFSPDILPGKVRDRTFSDTVILGLCSRLIDNKGIPLALQAIKYLLERGLDCQLEIAGTGPRENHYKYLAHKLGIAGNCRFHGFVSPIERFYDKIDILLLPSLSEPFGLASVEAAVRGCPVVVSRVDGLPETILEGQTGLSIAPTLPLEKYADFGGDPSSAPERVYYPEKDEMGEPSLLDPHDIADTVTKLVNNPKAYNYMSRKGIKFVQDNFSFERYAIEMSQIIESTITTTT